MHYTNTRLMKKLQNSLFFLNKYRRKKASLTLKHTHAHTLSSVAVSFRLKYKLTSVSDTALGEQVRTTVPWIN